MAVHICGIHANWDENYSGPTIANEIKSARTREYTIKRTQLTSDWMGPPGTRFNLMGGSARDNQIQSRLINLWQVVS